MEKSAYTCLVFSLFQNLQPLFFRHVCEEDGSRDRAVKHTIEAFLRFQSSLNLGLGKNLIARELSIYSCIRFFFKFFFTLVADMLIN